MLLNPSQMKGHLTDMRPVTQLCFLLVKLYGVLGHTCNVSLPSQSSLWLNSCSSWLTTYGDSGL